MLIAILFGLLILILGLMAYGVVYTVRMESRFPPSGSFVDVPGGRLHYLDQPPGAGASAGNNAPVIVLLHGASANLLDMRIGFMDALTARGFRVIAFDRPGHGYSVRTNPQARDVRTQMAMVLDGLDRLGVERPVIIGHSFGGALALAALTGHGDRVAGAVSLAGVSHTWSGGLSWYNALTLRPVIGFLFRRLVIPIAGPLMVPAGVERNFEPNPAVPDYVERAGLPLLFRPGNWLANAQDMERLKGSLAEMTPDYPAIAKPLLILFGDKDSTVSPERHGRRLHEAVPGSRYVLLDNVGHVPHQVRTEEVVSEIEAFVRSLPGADH